MKYNKKCAICNGFFTTNYKRKVCCSTKCAYKKEQKTSYRRKLVPYNIRLKIRINQKGMCLVCNQKKPLQLHHLNKNRDDNSFENLSMVCNKCHLEIHNKRSILYCRQ